MPVINYARISGPGDEDPPEDEPTEDQVWRNDTQVLERLADRIGRITDPTTVEAAFDMFTRDTIAQALKDLESIRDRLLTRIEEI